MWFKFQAEKRESGPDKYDSRPKLYLHTKLKGSGNSYNKCKYTNICFSYIM